MDFRYFLVILDLLVFAHVASLGCARIDLSQRRKAVYALAAIPILEAAADEENDELQDLWSRLLAAAIWGAEVED